MWHCVLRQEAECNKVRKCPVSQLSDCPPVCSLAKPIQTGYTVVATRVYNWTSRIRWRYVLNRFKVCIKHNITYQYFMYTEICIVNNMYLRFPQYGCDIGHGSCGHWMSRWILIVLSRYSLSRGTKVDNGVARDEQIRVWRYNIRFCHLHLPLPSIVY